MLLLATEAEAFAVPVEHIWKGDDREKCNEVLDALIEVGIAVHSRERLKKKLWPWVSIAFWRFSKPTPTSELEIWILRKDSTRATAIIQEIGRRANLDYDEEDEINSAS